MVLVHDNKLYSKGLAALKIIELLPFGIHKVLLIGKILPTFIINRIYDFVASIRYKIFGKKEECTIPSSDIRQRYIIN
jgi:predicted DCC family thiol-disulfide oxidoreductase YuxK